ncbi:hypothetical protein DCM90_06605 [Levilactobacillus bambusae]|uniref:AP2/ERF domain-containing protein n=1 Tax=Levilactobacillus bambusae TaxID=2024736 RepID=A0A2V1N025_9LACO|nr:hypothetical protein DCM90_06605 [Levilactobacillus bambusae]
MRKGNTRSCGCLRKEVAREKIFRQPNTIAHIGNSDTLQAAWHPSKKDAVRSKNRSGVTGVSYDRHHDLWIARLYYHRAYVLNRSFHTKEEAVAARLAAEAQYLN